MALEIEYHRPELSLPIYNLTLTNTSWRLRSLEQRLVGGGIRVDQEADFLP